LSGYAKGAAQIPQSIDINDKSHPNSTMNIHDSSGCAGGAAQIHTIRSQTSTIHQVIPEVLPKFLEQMIKIARLVPIRH
jgi:ATP-dependent protease ClpP protease subunit